jgi:xanthine dehydrogenase molybdopterin-binding subunit B
LVIPARRQCEQLRSIADVIKAGLLQDAGESIVRGVDCGQIDSLIAGLGQLRKVGYGWEYSAQCMLTKVQRVVCDVGQRRQADMKLARHGVWAGGK